ncbi:MAG: hypothetical protein P8J50_19725 [Acidimicrobiales bacterium]|nr:hypothetical protein [Acidimicrobiales bacterium]
MSDPLSDEQLPDDRFAARIQAEVMAAAEERRREDPKLARIEREIERAWADVAPPGAVGPTEELLLDRVDRLALVDVDAPIGTKPGVKQVKGAIRKGIYWYLRYMSDQLNAFHNVQARLLRRFDDRLSRLESVIGVDSAVDDLVYPAPTAGASSGRRLADAVGSGRVLVLAAGAGAALTELDNAYGVERDPQVALAGIDAGLDLRVGDPLEHLCGLEAGTIGAVLIGGALQRVSPAAAIALVASAAVACGPGGIVAVAVEDRSRRADAAAELLGDRGLAPTTWGAILGGVAASTESVKVDDDGLEALVVARLS